MAPGDLYDSGGEPEVKYDYMGDPHQDASHTIFALQKDAAAKFHKNERKHARRVEQLQAQGGFRAPESLNWKDRRILQATHEGQARQIAGFNGTRVVDTTGAEFEVSTVEPVPRTALSVRLPPRLQRPGRQRPMMAKTSCARYRTKKPPWLPLALVCAPRFFQCKA